MNELNTFLGGAVTFGFMISGLFFLRFWKRTHDRLFLAFASAFGLLGANQALLTLSDIPAEERSPLYLMRLAAFLLIILSVWRKNRQT